MKCEYCGGELSHEMANIDPVSFIKEAQKCWDELKPAIEFARKRQRCEETAQMILDARALYPDKSLAWLYDEVTIPPELREAHRLNDLVVMDLYGFSPDMTEQEIVSELMQMYEEMSNAVGRERIC